MKQPGQIKVDAPFSVMNLSLNGMGGCMLHGEMMQVCFSGYTANPAPGNQDLGLAAGSGGFDSWDPGEFGMVPDEDEKRFHAKSIASRIFGKSQADSIWYYITPIDFEFPNDSLDFCWLARSIYYDK